MSEAFDDDARVAKRIAKQRDVDDVTSKACSKKIAELREQVAHLSLYKPARRTEQQQEPVKAIGPCNEPFWFKGIRETDEQFAERAGTPYEQDA